MRRSLLRLCAPLALALSSAAPGARAEERVALAPERAPPWRASRMLDALRTGARAPRELRIESAPAGAQLELAYLRDGAELAHARGAAPLVATLPGRALTGESDRIWVRAELAGFAPRELALGARELAPSLRVELAALPRTLLAATLLELGPRSRLELISDRALEARLTATESGWRLALADVAPNAPLAARIEALAGAAFARAALRVAGGDWIVELARAPGERSAPRLLRREEPVRGVSRLSLEWSREGDGEAALAAGRSALSRLDALALGACGAAFEDSLVASLGDEALARALAPSGAFTDAFVALALDAVAARAPDAELVLRDASRLRLDSALARASAAARAASVRGTLVAVRALAHALAPPGAGERALNAWLAPERAPDEFDAALSRAAAAEARCRAQP